ncbi:MAG: hypothetical protein AAGF32_10940, partial [Pseudomonadota bacterium]
LFGPPQRLFLVLFATLPFGSFAVVPSQLIGGFTFTAGPILALLIVGRMALSPGGVSYALTAAFRPNRLMLLFLLLVIACVTTLFMPRLLARSIEVIPFRAADLSVTVPLRPTPQNISQLIYLVISIFTVLAAAFFLRAPGMRQHVLTAICMGAAMTVTTGLVDFVSQYLPLGAVLAPFRTATYALAVDVNVLGGKRVVGLMPEASAFGGLCLSFLTALVFFRFAIADRWLRERAVPLLIVALIVMIWLAKSTSAYAGLGVVGVLAAVHWLVHAGGAAGRGRSARSLSTEFWAAFTAIMGFFLIMLALPALLDPLFAIIDRMVLSKAASSSFEERGLWRSTAWQAFTGSGLLGVGAGATRASSSIVGMFAAVGLAGALAYYAFLLQTALRRAAPGDKEGAIIVGGFGWFIIPDLVVGFFVGSPDFGIFNAVIFGLVTAVGLSRRPNPQVSPAYGTLDVTGSMPARSPPA